uniref:Uncharacterized protein n=1 Tax=Oryza sativa subsp. japonica TaxID=39947 RepID=Q7EZ46_ORYSJ|nr:hypothetical protein [Oryza sativa Japonica Group]BAC98653.1 hypothetical protein [Oryza sativa Japonica Group]
MQMLMSVFVIIIGCYTAIGWITDIVIFIMSVAFVVVKYFLHLHDWWISPSPLMRVYVFIVADLTVADWFLRLHGYATSLPLIGVIVFTTTDIFYYF